MGAARALEPCGEGAGVGDRAGREDASDGGPGGRWRVHSCGRSSGEPAARGGGDTGGRAPGRAAGEACIGCAFDTVYGDDATGVAHWAGCDRWLHSTALFTNLGLSWHDEPAGVRKRRVWPDCHHARDLQAVARVTARTASRSANTTASSFAAGCGDGVLGTAGVEQPTWATVSYPVSKGGLRYTRPLSAAHSSDGARSAGDVVRVAGRAGVSVALTLSLPWLHGPALLAGHCEARPVYRRKQAVQAAHRAIETQGISSIGLPKLRD